MLGGVSWRVVVHPAVADWLASLDEESLALVTAAIDRLADTGPTLGRPLVDRVKASRHHNLKELRPGSAGRSEVRILFAFDPRRQAILLAAGDKSGQWRDWYKRMIPIADDRYDAHTRRLEED
jgi:hypothetical protein